MPRMRPDPNPGYPISIRCQGRLCLTSSFGARSRWMNGSGSRRARKSGSGHFASTGRRVISGPQVGRAEPPGETHTLIVPDDVEEMITYFQVKASCSTATLMESLWASRTSSPKSISAGSTTRASAGRAMSTKSSADSIPKAPMPQPGLFEARQALVALRHWRGHRGGVARVGCERSGDWRDDTLPIATSVEDAILALSKLLRSFLTLASLAV